MPHTTSKANYRAKRKARRRAEAQRRSLAQALRGDDFRNAYGFLDPTPAQAMRHIAWGDGKMFKVKAARLAKGWTQRDLAFYAKLTEADISKIERGWHKPFPRQAARLAEVLGLRPEELLEEVPDGERKRA